jgi:hypothetical protein
MSEPASTSIEVTPPYPITLAPVAPGARSRLYSASPLNESRLMFRVSQSLPALRQVPCVTPSPSGVPLYSFLNRQVSTNVPSGCIVRVALPQTPAARIPDANPPGTARVEIVVPNPSQTLDHVRTLEGVQESLAMLFTHSSRRSALKPCSCNSLTPASRPSSRPLRTSLSPSPTRSWRRQNE